MLRGRKILLGITGSIAAYKAAVLIRLLVREGAEVKVIMTPLAKQFITPLTLATLAKNPILVDFFDPENGAWNSHVSLGEWADYYLIAPATANTLAKMANGTADNLLLTTYLSARCPVAVAPAMDLDMYAHPATQENLDRLRLRGVTVIDPDEGELASGLAGKGRMAEPEYIAQVVNAAFSKKKALSGKHILVTAGPTVEPLDPVRFLSNHSSGKMGYALAAEFAERGARVTLVSGRTNLCVPAGVERIDVLTAEEMYRAAVQIWPEVDGAVMCAAVADYTPVEVSDRKLKKGNDDLVIRLKRTHDIAAELGRDKGSRILVGFALESHDELRHAEEKRIDKNLDFIVLNSLQDPGACFGTDTNKITILSSSGIEAYPLETKNQAAIRIADVIQQKFNASSHAQEANG